MSPPDAIFTAGLRTPFAQAGKGACKDTRPDDLLIKLLDSNKNKYPAHGTELWAAVQGWNWAIHGVQAWMTLSFM